jgi:hypothetical protein
MLDTLGSGCIVIFRLTRNRAKVISYIVFIDLVNLRHDPARTEKKSAGKWRCDTGHGTGA